MALNHTIRSGDCISSLAFRHGFFPDTLWGHPDNADLKRRRRDPNVLLAGDLVAVPDLRPKEEDAATQVRHRFRRKGVPEKLRIKIEDEEGKPVASTPYEITIDGKHRRGKTDAEGWVIESIPPDARGGTLLVGKRGEEQEHQLNLGHLDPIEELTGVQARLKNLGFDCGVDGQLSDATREAIKKFQVERALDPTGEPDDATREQLKQEHQS